jgi:hypothetical protein
LTLYFEALSINLGTTHSKMDIDNQLSEQLSKNTKGDEELDLEVS